MAFYHDFTVEDSYRRINKSLDNTKVEDRLKNVQSYKGKPWYKMPNARGTESADTFPSFLGTREIDHNYQPSFVPSSERQEIFNTINETDASFNNNNNSNNNDFLRPGGEVELQRHGALTPINPEELQHKTIDNEKDVNKNLKREEEDHTKRKKPLGGNILNKKFRRNILQATSKIPLIEADNEGNSMVSTGMFEKSELRENLLKLQDIAFDGFRERIHKKWDVFKTEFLTSHLRGLSVWQEIPVMIIRSGCGVTHAQLESMLKVLPERFQNKRARLRYFEFVEYFGVLHENGMVSEPEPIVIVEDEEEEKEVKTSNKEEASDEESVVVEHDVSTKADTSNDNIQQDEIPIKIDDDTSVKEIEGIPLNMENHVKYNDKSNVKQREENEKKIDSTKIVDKSSISNDDNNNNNKDRSNNNEDESDKLKVIPQNEETVVEKKVVVESDNAENVVEETSKSKAVEGDEEEKKIEDDKVDDESTVQIGRHGAKIANDYMKYENVHELDQNAENIDEDAKYEKRAELMDNAIEATRTFSAVLIQSSARGFIVRRRDKLRKALGHCLSREEGWLRRCLREWHLYTKRMCGVRYHCKRQLYKWRRYTRRLKQHRKTFKGCYWTFHVWRKYVADELYSKAKAQNVAHIFNTYWLLKHFKHFKMYYLKNRARRKFIAQKCKEMDDIRSRKAVKLWHEWAAHQAIVLKNWREKGRAFAKGNYVNRNIVWFAIWRYQAYLQILVDERSLKWWAYPRGVHSVPKAASFGYKEVLPALPSVEDVSLKHRDDVQIKVREHLQDYCVDLAEANAENDAYLRAIHFACVSRVGRKFLSGLKMNLIDKRKNRYAVSWYRKRLLRKVFKKYHRVITKIIADRHLKKKNIVKVRKGSADFPSLFSQDDVQNPKAWNKNKSEVEPLLSPKVNVGDAGKVEDGKTPDEIAKTAIEIAAEMEQKLLEEQRLKDEKVRIERERRRNNLIQAEKRRNERMAQAKEEWEADIIRRRRALEDGKEISKRFKSAKTRAHEVRIIDTIKTELDSEAYGIKREVEAKVKKEEEAITKQHRSDVIKHMTALRQKRGGMLVNAVYKVWEEVEQKYVKELATLCLRRMRIFVTQKNSLKLYKRRRLKNWLRICSRLRYLDRGMPLYYSMRVKWSTLNRWLDGVYQRHRLATPRIGLKIARRKKLLQYFSSCVDGEFAIPHSLLQSHPRALFSRWVEYTQMEVCYKEIVGLCRKRRRLQTLLFGFKSFELLLKRKYTIEKRKKSERFNLIRATLDLQTWKSRLLAPYRRLTTTWTRKKNRFITYKLKLNSRKADSFKKFERRWEASIRKRIKLEKRMLFLEFLSRGRTTYDLEAIKIPDRLLDEEDISLGKEFTDINDVNQNCYAVSVDIYLTDWVSGLSINLQQTAGEPISTPLRGSDDGTKKTFTLNVEGEEKERLVRVEMNVGNIVGRIRFITSTGRKSPWYGKLPSKKITPVEGDRTRSIDFAEIIGFCGRSRFNDFTDLGIIVRYPKDACVFSNCWRPEEGLDLKSQQSQFATVLRMRSCDLLASYDRAKAFMRKVRATGNKSFVPTCFQENCEALGKWYFEALSRGLIGVYDDVEEGEARLAKGQILERDGEEMIRIAKEKLQSIVEYRTDGNHEVRPYYTQGARLSREILEDIQLLEDTISEGKKVIEDGKQLVIEARKMLPQLPVTMTLKKYFERLYDLALMSESLGAEAFKKRSKGLTEEMAEAEQHQMEMGEMKQEKNTSDLRNMNVQSGLGADIAGAFGAVNSMKEAHIVNAFKM